MYLYVYVKKYLYAKIFNNSNLNLIMKFFYHTDLSIQGDGKYCRYDCLFCVIYVVY